MNDTIKEWIAKSEEDYATAKREIAVTEFPSYSVICFHAQQCVEKLMKALLIKFGQVPPRTHHLVVLHTQLKPVCPDWEASLEDLQFLTRAGMDFRYPGEPAEFPDAEEALLIADKLRTKLLRLLNQ